MRRGWHGEEAVCRKWRGREERPREGGKDWGFEGMGQRVVWPASKPLRSDFKWRHIAYQIQF